MNKDYSEKNVDDYITISKSLQKSINESLPNSEFIDEISMGLIDALKPIADYNQSIAKLYSDELLKTQKMIKSMIEPLTEMTKSIIEAYNPFMNRTISNITKILENIDWSEYDLIFKEISIKYLSNGFYPYRNTEIKYDELLITNSKIKQTKIIKIGIKTDIKKNRKLLLSIYPQYKVEIKEIYNLYHNGKYRLCILSLINLISIINNPQYEFVDFTERRKIREKLLEKHIMKEKETNYLVFSPYINDNVLKNENVLLKNCNNKDYQHPEEYL